MKHLTPMDAQRSLKYAEENDSYLAVGHRRALETIAAMQPEYSVRYERRRPRQFSDGGHWSTLEDPAHSLEHAKELAASRNLSSGGNFRNARVITRYVTEQEEA